MAKFSKLKVGEKLSETTIYSVEKIVGKEVQLRTESGESVILDDKYVDSLLSSATQYEKEEKKTKTELAQIFSNSTNVVLTVCYNKQVKDEDVLKELMNSYQNATPKTIEAEFKKSVKKALNGEQRELTGVHTGAQDDFGRTHITDLNIAKDPSKSYDVRSRLVDSRTIQWLIVKNVKYSLK